MNYFIYFTSDSNMLVTVMYTCAFVIFIAIIPAYLLCQM